MMQSGTRPLLRELLFVRVAQRSAAGPLRASPLVPLRASPLVPLRASPLRAQGFISTWVFSQSGPMFVPAVVYLIVNLISYPALERINASVFTAISQLKV
jgi:hypothetical protein